MDTESKMLLSDLLCYIVSFPHGLEHSTDPPCTAGTIRPHSTNEHCSIHLDSDLRPLHVTKCNVFALLTHFLFL